LKIDTSETQKKKRPEKLHRDETEKNTEGVLFNILTGMIINVQH
jgi:hypothetical protein